MSAPSIQSQARQESATEIHASAVVSPRAQIGYECFVGPYVIIGDDVTLGDRVRIDAHCVIDGHTRIGDDTHIFPFVRLAYHRRNLKFSARHPKQRLAGAIASANSSPFIVAQRVAAA